ncbi:unnamed protein product [Brachionus calyciflorus]|uniref:Uncharacterized protein n=1 Tax=Brachionus calyciflorus TaxID=104777 RepID=A0A813RCE1_9BILA|nr:unnamed protein product [Brachionus calyciflorus]
MAGLSEPYNESFLPLIQKYYSLEAIAREPWHSDTILFLPSKNQMFIENGGAESIATSIYLSLLNLNHEIRYVKNVNEMSPSGKGPLLKCGKYSIGEFEPIVNFCNLKGYRLLANYLDNSKKTEIKSYILLIQKAFSETIEYLLWKNNSVQKVIKESFNQNYSWPLNHILYLNEFYFNRNKLVSNKIWNLEKLEVLEKFRETNDCLNKKLEGSLYLIGNNMTEADILLFSYLKVLHLYSDFDETLNLLHDFRNINDFYANMSRKLQNILMEKLELN